jgi:hypothetical protein
MGNGKTNYQRPLRPKPKRLTTANRIRVRSLIARGVPAAAVAEHFDVSVFVIEAVAKGQE